MKVVAVVLAILLTLSLTTAVFAASPIQPVDSGTGTATRLATTWQSRETSASETSRIRPLTRIQQAVQNRVKSSDFEELRMTRQDLMESGKWDQYKETLEPSMTELQRFREESRRLWEDIREMNQEIRALTKVLRESLLAVPTEERAVALRSFREAISVEQQAVEDVRKEIRELQILKHASWHDFKAALLAEDVTAAEDALEVIISRKKEIIALQSDFVDAKQSMIDFLESWADAE